MVLSCGVMLGAQVITIKDKLSGEPIEFVTLSSEKPNVSAVTNGQGQADVSAFAGAEKIEIRMIGYAPETRSYAELQSMSWVVMMGPSATQLDEFVITSATRWGQTSTDVPSRIAVISAKEAQLQNPQTTADLLGMSGKVFIQKSQQGGGSPMIRGFATNRLIYSVDGVRMNTAIFRSGNLQNVISLDPFAIEKSEILFGPGSVIYGSDAIGGVMSFQTLTPQLSLNDDVYVSGGGIWRTSSANKELTQHYHVSVGWKKWAMVTSISSNRFGDLRMGSKGPDEYLRPIYVQRADSIDHIVSNEDPRVQKPSGYDQVNLMQKVRFAPNKKWDMQYAFHYSETSPYARYDRHIRYRKGLPRYGEWSYGPQKWMMNNLSVVHQSKSRLADEVALRLAWQVFEESRIDRDIDDPIRHIRIEKVNAYSANVDFNKAIGARHKLFYGVEAVINDVASTGIDEDISAGTSSAGPSRYPQAKWHSYAAYVEEQFHVSSKTTLQAGVRYNIFSMAALFDTSFYPFPFTTAKLNKSSVTGNLGMVYRPGKKWIVRANLGTAFRSPNVDDLGKVFDSEQGSVVVPNPSLDAEYAYNAEAGLVKLFGEKVRLDLTGYYTVLQNAMVRRDFTLNGLDSIMYDGTMSKVQAIQNAASATVYGAQAALELKLPAGFAFSTDFNYQVGEEELDDGTFSPLRHASPWFGMSRLDFQSGKLHLQVNAMYSGERKFEDMPEEEKGKSEIYAVDDQGNPWSPGWYTLNFKAQYQFSYFTINAGVENLLDVRYRPYSSGIVAPGRNFVTSVRFTF